MQTSNPVAGTFTKTILIIGFVCVAALGCAYMLYHHMASDHPLSKESVTQTVSLMLPAQPAAIDEDENLHIDPPVYYTIPIIIDSVRIPAKPEPKPAKQTKAQQLFDELVKHENFQKALENPNARANINRMLNHPEIEKKLNGWFAIAIRAAIHSKVKEPDFPDLIADAKYVDDLFVQYGIS